MGLEQMTSELNRNETLIGTVKALKITTMVETERLEPSRNTLGSGRRKIKWAGKILDCPKRERMTIAQFVQSCASENGRPFTSEVFLNPND